MNHPRSAVVLSILALLIVIYGVTILIVQQQKPEAPAPPVVAPSAKGTPPSPAVLQQLKESHGFQAFVSYTNGSFEPATSTIKVGQVIRYTNNSSHNIWIGQITDKNTPEKPNTQYCDVPFNSCHALHPGDFAEFTFPQAGTFYYMDDLNTATRGAVVVR